LVRLDAAQGVHRGKARFRQIKAFLRQRQQVFPLQKHPGPYRLLVPRHRPDCVSVAALKQLRVELGQVPCLRHWDPMIAPEGTHLSFNATLLMPLARRAEFGAKPPVGAERHKAGGFLSPGTPQYPLHR
jgi:hypothetical protein